MIAWQYGGVDVLFRTKRQAIQDTLSKHPTEEVALFPKYVRRKTVKITVLRVPSALGFVGILACIFTHGGEYLIDAIRSMREN